MTVVWLDLLFLNTRCVGSYAMNKSFTTIVLLKKYLRNLFWITSISIRYKIIFSTNDSLGLQKESSTEKALDEFVKKEENNTMNY